MTELTRDELRASFAAIEPHFRGNIWAICRNWTALLRTDALLDEQCLQAARETERWLSSVVKDKS
jgi:hypothetical protein